MDPGLDQPYGRKFQSFVADYYSTSQGSTEYLSVLTENMVLKDYKTPLSWPVDENKRCILDNFRINEVGDNLNASEPYVILRYQDNTVAAFNYLTGSLLFIDDSEKRNIDFLEYADMWIKGQKESLNAVNAYHNAADLVGSLVSAPIDDSLIVDYLKDPNLAGGVADNTNNVLDIATDGKNKTPGDNEEAGKGDEGSAADPTEDKKENSSDGKDTGEMSGEASGGGSVGETASIMTGGSGTANGSMAEGGSGTAAGSIVSESESGTAAGSIVSESESGTAAGSIAGEGESGTAAGSIAGESGSGAAAGSIAGESGSGAAAESIAGEGESGTEAGGDSVLTTDGGAVGDESGSEGGSMTGGEENGMETGNGTTVGNGVVSAGGKESGGMQFGYGTAAGDGEKAAGGSGSMAAEPESGAEVSGDGGFGKNTESQSEGTDSDTGKESVEEISGTDTGIEGTADGEGTGEGGGLSLTSDRAYVTMLTAESEGYEVFRASELLGRNGSVVLSENQKLQLLEEKGLLQSSIDLDSLKLSSEENRIGLILVGAAAASMLVLLGILYSKKRKISEMANTENEG